MGVEIERKFLVSGDGWRQGVTSSAAFRQGYLSTNANPTVRVRVVDDRQAFLTLKGKPVGLARAEFEYEIPVEDGLQLMELARPNVIEKRRYLVPHGNHTWEVDVFEGPHEGLVTAEVEMGSLDEAVEIPDWVGKDVSNDDRYANASLSRNPGVPEER